MLNYEWELSIENVKLKRGLFVIPGGFFMPDDGAFVMSSRLGLIF